MDSMKKGAIGFLNGKPISLDYEDLINSIKNLFEYMEEDIHSLRKENKRLEDIKGITENNAKINDMRKRALYICLSDKELQAKADFSEKHYHSCKGNTRIILEGTGIGTIVKCQCTKCNEIEDITDMSNW